MSLAKDLVGVGLAPPQAARLGFPDPVALAGAGTTAGGAAVVVPGARVVNVTAAAGQTGVRFDANAPLMQPYVLINVSGTAGVIYPTTGGTVNGLGANVGVALGANKMAIAYRTSNTTWAINVGA